MASSALQGYLPAFAEPLLDQHFLTYYYINPDKTLSTTQYTRQQFLVLAARAKEYLTSRGIQRGDHVCHCFSSNTVEDLAFRLASVFVGSIPVTVNWQADTPERVLYKVTVTGCKLVLIDAGTNPTTIEYLSSKLSTTNVASIVNAKKCVVNSDQATDGGEILSMMMMGEGETSLKHDPLQLDATRIIIFTSGTTGNPKGVQLSYTNYDTNFRTFEHFLQVQKPTVPVSVVVVNPLHHTNSTSFTDWMLRRPGATLHLFQRYTTPYWKILAQLGHRGKNNANASCCLVAPAVSRHFDFLESLVNSNRLGEECSEAWIQEGLNRVHFLIGSAPVGPSTVARLQRFAGKLPLVRFGSTETTLQVMGTPRSLSEEARLRSFQKGWHHKRMGGEAQPGYYIGQQHPGFTEVSVVESVSKEDGDCFMKLAGEGVAGYIVTRGGHVMTGYVDNEEATAKALYYGDIGDGGNGGNGGSGGSGGSSTRPWYLNLGDVGFWLNNEDENNQDIYWMSRDSALLIRGGSNYSYEQINTELKDFLIHRMHMESETTVAVVGLKLNSEHEDDCCVTIEMKTNTTGKDVKELETEFLALTRDKRTGVSKGAVPTHVRFAVINRNFKGAIIVKEIKNEWLEELRRRKSSEHVSDEKEG
jgi:acyl-CoA synthetase (AMP-forming)/AMP-acid ligase II